MKVILNENVSGLGKIGDIIAVADGYARNFLLPRSFAVVASSRNMKQMEHVKAIINRKAQKAKDAAMDIARQIGQLSIVFKVKAGENGRLFGSVGSKDILAELSRQGFDIDKKAIVLEKPLKDIGVFFLPVRIQPDVTGTLKVEVAAEVEETAVSAEARE